MGHLFVIGALLVRYSLSVIDETGEHGLIWRATRPQALKRTGRTILKLAFVEWVIVNMVCVCVCVATLPSRAQAARSSLGPMPVFTLALCAVDV